MKLNARIHNLLCENKKKCVVIQIFLMMMT